MQHWDGDVQMSELSKVRMHFMWHVLPGGGGGAGGGGLVVVVVYGSVELFLKM